MIPTRAPPCKLSNNRNRNTHRNPTGETRMMERGMISVDMCDARSQVYFLTHLHGDRCKVLPYTWKRGPLYCSRVTAKLFPAEFPDFDLSLLRPLDLGRWHSLSLTTPSSGSSAEVFVMAIDALHCPGSVMYLFRGNFGCMLYTGNFRWEKTGNGVEIARTMLLEALKTKALDILELDNTCCDPRYSFPSRRLAAKQIVDIINSHPKHDVIIAIDSLGKEDLLLYISRKLKIKIWVWPERLQIMHLLGFHENFTTNTTLTRIRAVPRYSFNIETLEVLNKIRCPTIGVMPSGLDWAEKAKHSKGNVFGSSSSDTSKMHELSGDSGKIPIRYHEYIYVVPFSDHSCFSEIKEFVELLRPIRIKGIIRSSCFGDPCFYFYHLCGRVESYWRIHGKVENEEGFDEAEAAEIEREVKNISASIARARRKRQRTGQFDFLGIPISRYRRWRKLSRGVKIADSDDDS